MVAFLVGVIWGKVKGHFAPTCTPTSELMREVRALSLFSDAEISLSDENSGHEMVNIVLLSGIWWLIHLIFTNIVSNSFEKTQNFNVIIKKAIANGLL